MDDRWTTWQAEQAGTSHGPTVAQVFGLLVVLALVALAASLTPTAAAQGGGPDRRPDRGSLCAEHAGRPGWQAVCRP